MKQELINIQTKTAFDVFASKITMQIKFKAFLAIFLINLMGSHQASSAGEPIFLPQKNTYEKLVDVRGKESIVEELTLGPEVTDFWKKIQIIASDSDYLFDFQKIIELFELTILHTESANDVSYKKPGIQVLKNIKDEHYRVMSHVDYAIAAATREGRRAIQFNIDLDLKSACISADEVHRVFGKGNIGIPTHIGVPDIFYKNPTGIYYSEGFGKGNEIDAWAPLVFSYAKSGCVVSIGFKKSITE